MALPGDLFRIAIHSGIEERLTRVNDPLLDEIEISVPESFWTEVEDGRRVQGWVMKPVGFKEGVSYPAILEIHGGPHAMYSNSFFHEFQLLAAQGYTVIYTNPGGSRGYGQSFTNVVLGDYGGRDYTDLLSAVDEAILQFPFIHPERLGVTGGSYGGFMTNWIVGHTDRFRAAVTQRSISNWLSMYGVSDIGYSFTEDEVGGNPWEDFELLWRQSPLAYVQQINTPLLILHGEQDLRCPIEQESSCLQHYVARGNLRNLSVFQLQVTSFHEKGTRSFAWNDCNVLLIGLSSTRYNTLCVSCTYDTEIFTKIIKNLQTMPDF